MCDSSCTVQLLKCLLPLALRWRESIVAKELLCLQQCCTLLECCKSSANGYEQCRRQIPVHEDFSYHRYPKFVSHIVTKNVTQVGVEEGKTRGIVCKHNCNFLRSTGNVDCYANFVVVVSLLNQRIHGFHNICDGSV